jgi:hypothetical protein
MMKSEVEDEEQPEDEEEEERDEQEGTLCLRGRRPHTGGLGRQLLLVRLLRV